MSIWHISLILIAAFPAVIVAIVAKARGRGAVTWLLISLIVAAGSFLFLPLLLTAVMPWFMLIVLCCMKRGDVESKELITAKEEEAAIASEYQVLSMMFVEKYMEDEDSNRRRPAMQSMFERIGDPQTNKKEILPALRSMLAALK